MLIGCKQPKMSTKKLIGFGSNDFLVTVLYWSRLSFQFSIYTGFLIWVCENLNYPRRSLWSVYGFECCVMELLLDKSLIN